MKKSCLSLVLVLNTLAANAFAEQLSCSMEGDKTPYVVAEINKDNLLENMYYFNTESEKVSMKALSESIFVGEEGTNENKTVLQVEFSDDRLSAVGYFSVIVGTVELAKYELPLICK